MNYLDYFHFDNYPFPTDNTYNYFYRRNKVLKIANDIANTCRFYSGVYVITGSEGCGKTVLLQQFVDTVKNNDAVFEIRANNNTDILKVLAENLGVKEAKNIENIFHSLNLIYEKGKNIIIVIDDAQNLSKEQLINLNALIDTVSYLRVVVCGNTKLKKIISGKIFHELRERIVKKYKLRHLSFFEGMNYISNISTSALALSQYKKVISFPALILLSFVSNRNIHNINKITDMALQNAFERNAQRVQLKDVFNVAKKNFDMVKLNIYLKFQKIFCLVLIALSIYFAVKITIDRYDLIVNLEARQSVKIQEKAIRSL